ncbi:MAG: amidohydrolase family protein [Alphaproteobacteria bacterium]
MPVPNIYDGPIIDTHIHLWRYAEQTHPWLADQGLEALRRDHLPDHYAALAGALGIVGSIHVEAGRLSGECVAETQWLCDGKLPRGTGDRLVAHVPLGQPQAVALLEDQLACDRVVGVRDILSWHPDPQKTRLASASVMDDPVWRENFGHLERLGLSFDLLITPWQALDAYRLAMDHPAIPIAINHCGSPIDRDAEGMARWRAGLHQLAKAPNTVIKISDPVAYDPHWTAQSLREVILACLDAFGPARAMFGSDYPVSGLHIGFADWVDTMRTVARILDADEQARLFHGTATRIYRLAI